LRERLRSLRYRVALSGGVFLAVTWIVFTGFAQKEVHQFEGQCTLCHLSEGEKIFGDIFVRKI